MSKVRFVVLILLSGFTYSCIEVYNPPEIQGNDNYLVVEGTLDAGSGTCTVHLARTVSLGEDVSPQPVIDASVIIEDNNNRKYILTPADDGVYSFNLNVNPELKYRLKISDGSDEYESSFVEVPSTPPIEKVAWRIEEDDVKIYLSTRNTEHGTRYYQWRFTETWEYNSAFRSFLKFENGDFVLRDSPDEIYYCWKTDYSTKIFLGNSVSLQEDRIENFLLQQLPLSSRQFQSRYSILVSQTSLTKEAYDFWLQVKNNTEAGGSLFDVQPSRINGNIHHTNGNKPVVGYFNASVVQNKRIFIDTEELPITQFETGYKYCSWDSLLIADIPAFTGEHLIVDELVMYVDGGGPRSPPVEVFLGYAIGTPYCVDCRVNGGINSKPDFWEDPIQQ